MDSPPKRLVAVPASIRQELLRNLADEEQLDETAVAWIEKIRRFCGLYGRRLSGVADTRFESEKSAHMEWMARVMFLAASRPSEHRKLPIDVPLLNSGFYALDAIGSRSEGNQDIFETANDLLNQLSCWHQQDILEEKSDCSYGPEFSSDYSRMVAESSMAPSVVIICPNKYSTLTLPLLGLMQQLNIPVRGIVFRKFSIARFREEFRRDGWKMFVWRVWRKLVVRGNENAVPTAISASNLMKGLSSNITDAQSYAEENDIPYVRIEKFDQAIDWLKSLSPDIGLFTGGGLTSAAFQDVFTNGIVNCHMGMLPKYRGMDVVEAPVLAKDLEQIGMTLHFMDSGIDTGPVLQKMTLTSDGYSSIEECRNGFGGLMPIALLDTALGVGSGRLAPVIQEGKLRQHYFVHAKLRQILRDSGIWQSSASTRPPRYLDLFHSIVSGSGRKVDA